MKNHVSDSLVHHNRDTSKIYTFKCILFFNIICPFTFYQYSFQCYHNFFWSIVYNIMLVSAVQWIQSNICIHISSPAWTSLSHPFSPSHPSRKLSSLCYTAGPTSYFFLHMVAYICQCYPPNSSYFPFPTPGERRCSIYIQWNIIQS